MIFLAIFVLLMCVLVFVGYFNEKTFKLPTEIALLIASFVIGLAYIIISYTINPNHTPTGFPINYLSDFLVKGVLCFMLFSGSCRITFSKLKRNIKPISLLAILTTTLSTALFGAISYALLSLFGITSFSLLECFLLGAIISPTDPIAATGILNKFGLSEDLLLTIEGESLFNDGVGIAIFVAISSLMTSSAKSFSPSSFFVVLGREVIGAVIVGLAICFVMYYFFKTTEDKFRQIFISILALTSSYVICQYADFSSAISAVISGICFASFTIKNEQEAEEKYRLYFDFWEVLDNLLNHLLYIVLGIFFVNIFLYTKGSLGVIVLAIASGILARFFGVFLVSHLINPIPEKLSRFKFSTLLTWSGLKGALSLALMIEASSLVSSLTFHTMIICVFSIVMFTTVIQGLTVKSYYQKIHQSS